MTTFAETKARDAAWRKAYDTVMDESDATPGDVTDEHSARLDELHEEAEAIEAAYSKFRNPEAKRAASAFRFLFRNVSEMGRGPKHVIALCEAAIA